MNTEENMQSISANKKIVLEFEELAFNKKDLEKAAEHLADNLIQHNPQVPDGKEGFVQGMTYFFKENPNLKLDVKNVIATDNFVILHVWGDMDAKNPESPKMAIIDIFRLKDGKIAEHWDVLQTIPETANNSNGMF